MHVMIFGFTGELKVGSTPKKRDTQSLQITKILQIFAKGVLFSNF